MFYSDITFNDKNAVKRWLHQRRLVSALKAVRPLGPTSAVICDFGAGNGELCRHIAVRYPKVRMVCYEPSPHLLKEAKDNLTRIQNVTFLSDITGLENNSVDLVFALEVFEHLPPLETRNALRAIDAILKPGGQLIIGVPVEVGIPALYKGIFRMLRRYGDFDAKVKNVLMAVAGRPPAHRPVKPIVPGFNYHFEHLGFDYRKFMKAISDTYGTQPQVSFSPASFFGSWIMPEVYFSLVKET